MVGFSWTPGCPVGRTSLRYLTVNFWGFDGLRSRGAIVVNASIANQSAAAFTHLYEQRFRIRQMRVMDSSWGHNPKGPGADDYAAMQADNTSAFNCRYVGGEESRKIWSNHAHGTAIDVNTFENPYVDEQGRIYPDPWFLTRRSRHAGVFASTSSPSTQAFTVQGFRWGGVWSPPDFQHFDVAPRKAQGLSVTRVATAPALAPPTPPSPPRPKPEPPGCDVPSGVSSRQVVLVDARGSEATIRACERSGSRYRQVLGPYAGHVGLAGVSPAKREGDLRTPTGVFPLRGGFGVNDNPGLGAGSWIRVDARDVWVDDPRSALYNTHQRLPVGGRWNSAERLQRSPAYNYAQVIGYNEARAPGAGSAIFMHVDQGRGTAGCVSLPAPALLSVMRWERPGVVMAITP